MRENKEICSKCGGDCCKRLPGAYFPEDLLDKGNMLDVLTRMFKSGKYAIDWWDGDATGKNERDSTYFIRPAVKNANKLFCGVFRGECVYLDKDGCTLSFKDRPTQCRELIPVDSFCCRLNYKFDRCASAVAWIPYEKDILRAGETARVKYEIADALSEPGDSVNNPPTKGVTMKEYMVLNEIRDIFRRVVIKHVDFTYSDPLMDKCRNLRIEDYISHLWDGNIEFLVFSTREYAKKFSIKKARKIVKMLEERENEYHIRFHHPNATIESDFKEGTRIIKSDHKESLITHWSIV